MKTKNIFKTLAFAMMMPAMLLTTACSSEDELANNKNIDNAEAAINKGFSLPVTVNVTRQGDSDMRAVYNESTRMLEFSAGDKLLVRGNDNSDGGAGRFAGLLDYDTEKGNFSGTIYTENSYSGTADALFTAANSNWVGAALFPNGYESYEFLSLSGSGYSTSYSMSYNKAIAATKAAAVEQFSLESAKTYSSGFALSPENAILNFTITGLTDGAKDVVLKNGESNMFSGSVTPTSGTAAFALGAMIKNYMDFPVNLKNVILTIGSTDIDITDTNNNLTAGKIYNITRSAAPALTYPIALSAVTSDYVGSVVTTDGNVYATVAAASAASKTAVAVIAYVGTAGSVDASSDTYKGLAVALSDANSGSNCQWAEDYANCLSSSQTSDIVAALGFKNGITCTSTLTGDGHTHAAATAAASNNGTTAPTGTSGWFMPSMGQWNLIVQGLATKKAGSAVTTDLTYLTDNPTYKADNLNSVITDAGGTGFKTSSYWASTEQTFVRAWAIYFANGYATNYAKTVNYYVRSIIAF